MLKTRAMVILLVFLTWGSWPGGSRSLAAQDPALARGTVGLGLLLRRLDGVKRVLMIGAHPDDEDTSLLAALSRGLGAETAYLSLTRGEGGQNLLGDELDEGLGLLRTGELLAARSLDGGRQYFTRAFDFGYSKSAEETFRYWPRTEVLSDVTWVVRTFRPHVIISVFSGTSRDGHGQHQVAGMIARAVFETAGDSSAFPEQLESGAALWSPSKLYLRSRAGPDDADTEVETGRFDPLIGRSYFQLAMESRSQHRSQDMGMPQPLGPRASRLQLLASRAEADDGGEDAFFAGVDTTLMGLAGRLEGQLRTEAEKGLRAYRVSLGAARQELDAQEPWRTTPHLGEALVALRGVVQDLEDGGAKKDEAAAEVERVLRERLSLLEEAVLRSRGIIVDARVEADLLVPGEEAGVLVQVWNGGPLAVSVREVDLTLPLRWAAELQEGGEGGEIAPGEIQLWRFLLRVPGDAEASRPYFLSQPREGELYGWPPDRDLWGLPGTPPLVSALVRLHLEGPGALAVRRNAVYRGVDKATGEFSEPVLVVPAFSVTLDPGGVVWPAGSSETRAFTVRVRRMGTELGSGILKLELPEGWRADPLEYAVDLREAGAEASFPFRVTAPRGLVPGGYTIEATVRGVDGAVYREGFVLVDYPHVARSALFPPATARVSVMDVSLEPGLRVGYVMGSGDPGAEVLRQMGASVRMLGPEAVRSGAYGDLDVVVLGIRAYETRPDLVAANQQLLDFARGGGTVIAQYNKYEFPQGGFAPYPVSMSRPHDRVSDETAPVRILDPTHPLFNHPNRIGEDDFLGWVQERGLYFLSEWDDRYVPLLEMADPGEGPKRGGLVLAPVGRGLYVYTGLAFFRQFPEGVPGALRLFANLASLKGNGDGGS